MHKLLPIAALIATVQIALAVPDARARSFCPSCNPSAAGAHGPDGAVMLAGGMGGGGMSGGLASLELAAQRCPLRLF